MLLPLACVLEHTPHAQYAQHVHGKPSVTTPLQAAEYVFVLGLVEHLRVSQRGVRRVYAEFNKFLVANKTFRGLMTSMTSIHLRPKRTKG